MGNAELVKRVKERGSEVMGLRGLSSALSAANAIKDHLKYWHFGTDKPVSMGIYISDANKGEWPIVSDIVCSVPVTVSNGVISACNHISTDKIKDKIDITVNE